MTDTKMTVATAQPLDFTGMMEVAKQLVPTGFLPEHIKTPGQCVAIILAGRELGMEPMLALRSITMVKGKIVVNADAQLALFKARGGRATFTTLSDTVAELALRHPNGDEHTERFTIEEAQRAGVTKRSFKSPNEPSMWEKYPKAMLRSRCITAGLKSIGFEPTAGAYDPEEAAAFTVLPVESQPLPALPPAEGDTMDFEITRETEITWGKKAGTAIKDLDTGYLEWATDSSRKFGDRTEEWQAAFQVELTLREMDAGEVADAELLESEEVPA